ncbi:MAG: winged helix-turn-helix domain-containing protein [Candidatus Thermoplasmatota archaeon]
MVQKRRSEIQIIGEILDISKNGVKKTELLYQSNMSFTQLQQYLDFMIKKNILRENVVINHHGEPNKVYVTTPKGNELRTMIHKTLSYFE